MTLSCTLPVIESPQMLILGFLGIMYRLTHRVFGTEVITRTMMQKRHMGSIDRRFAETTWLTLHCASLVSETDPGD